jgi:hypothetical protein
MSVCRNLICCDVWWPPKLHVRNKRCESWSAGSKLEMRCTSMWGNKQVDTSHMHVCAQERARMRAHTHTHTHGVMIAWMYFVNEGRTRGC